MAICLKHTDREATTRCTTCFKPLCAECALPGYDKVFCSDKCMQNYAASEDRLAVVAARDKAIARKERIRRLIILLVAILLAVAAFIFLKKNPTTAEKLKSGTKSLTKQAVDGARDVGAKLKEQ